MSLLDDLQFIVGQPRRNMRDVYERAAPRYAVSVRCG